jgi:hypothetical protein
VSIFEGQDEAANQQGRASDLGGGAPHDLALDPFRGAIAELLDEGCSRVGTLVSDVEVWWRTEGLLRRRDVDPREVVVLELMFDPVELDEDGYPVELPWVDQTVEQDDPLVRALLEGVLLYPGRDLSVRWFQGADAVRERALWEKRFDSDPTAEPGR